MKHTALCFPLTDDKILLGLKKYGFGKGKYDGFGGKPETGETMEQTAVRELKEECGLIAVPENLVKGGEVTFHHPYKPEWTQTVHVFLVKNWSGQPIESNEMVPEWFDLAKIPYDKMWESERKYIPQLLAGEFLTGSIVFSEDGTVAEDNVIVKD